MSAWSWVILGVAAFLLLSVVVSAAVAALLGRISQEVSELLEPESWASAQSWASAPLTREVIQEEQEASASVRARSRAHATHR